MAAAHHHNVNSSLANREAGNVVHEPRRAEPAGSATVVAPWQPGTDLLLMCAARACPRGVAGALKLLCWQEAALWHADRGKVAQTSNLTGSVT